MWRERGNPMRFALAGILFKLAFSGALMAGDWPAESHFQKGLFETSVGSGAMFSPFATGLSRPTLDYTVTEVRLGYMLTNPSGSNYLRGNFEVLGSLFGGAIFEGEGNYVSGMTCWMRYNFVPFESRFVPFVEGGLGLTQTDLDRRIEGQSFNFNLNLGVGVRCFVARNWSVNLDYRYQHISNAYLSHHNLGVNACGAVLSVSYFF